MPLYALRAPSASITTIARKTAVLSSWVPSLFVCSHLLRKRTSTKEGVQNAIVVVVVVIVVRANQLLFIRLIWRAIRHAPYLVPTT